MSTQNKKLFDYRFQFNIGTVIHFTWCNLAPVLIILHWLKVKITGCSFCIHRDFKSVFITVITKTELPETLRSVQCHRKRIIVSKLRSSLLFEQITNYCKMYMCKKCAISSHMQMCLCLLILLAISFLDYPQVESWYGVNYNSPTVCSGQLILQRYCLARFEISGNLSFCLLRSLTSFDGKVTTRIVIGFGAKKYEILPHLRITKLIFILLVISCLNFWQVASRELPISLRLCLYD